MDIILRKIAEKNSSLHELTTDRIQLHCIVINNLRDESKHVFLKMQAITQLGYSRNKTDACLPDELIKHIKEYIFYDLTKVEMQEKKMLAIWKQHDDSFRNHWLQHHCHGDQETKCSCYTNCVQRTQLCIMIAIQRFVI